MRIGANYSERKCDFIVWAPKRNQVDLQLIERNELLRMKKVENGYWILNVPGLNPDVLYTYLLDGKESKPDPASHFQPTGVFGPSQVIDHGAFKWKDGSWTGVEVRNLFFYEIHVGTFTRQGTFKAASERIKDIAELGFNAVELMPISQFSGTRNWGYDGVFPFAVQNTYGTPYDLKELVNECHLHNVALFIDCVYNHVGPEGNCLNDFAPYFPSTRIGQWGPSINLDGKLNDGVRNFFSENVLHWLGNFHFDGIRLDAVQTMMDTNPNHFLQEINSSVRLFSDKIGRKCHLIAESGYNIPQLLLPLNQCGYGFDAQWLDDFQHAIFALLTGEKEGYYRNYGSLQDVIEVLNDAYLYVGGEYDFKRRDESYRDIPAYRFIVFSQNHDQIGNRLLGDRLTSIAGIEAAKLASAMVFLSPYVPLIFMGEEWGEIAPFLFFTDYQGKDLIANIRDGRRHEFVEFHWQGEVPDSQDQAVFEQSKIRWEKRDSEDGKNITSFYRQLIKLKKIPIFHSEADRQIKVSQICENVLLMYKESGNSKAIIIANFSKQQSTFTFPLVKGNYLKIFDSADIEWSGPGSNLPCKTIAGDRHFIPGYCVAVYLSEINEGDIG